MTEKAVAVQLLKYGASRFVVVVSLSDGETLTVQVEHFVYMASQGKMVSVSSAGDEFPVGGLGMQSWRQETINRLAKEGWDDFDKR